MGVVCKACGLSALVVDWNKWFCKVPLVLSNGRLPPVVLSQEVHHQPGELLAHWHRRAVTWLRMLPRGCWGREEVEFLLWLQFGLVVWTCSFLVCPMCLFLGVEKMTLRCSKPLGSRVIDVVDFFALLREVLFFLESSGLLR